MRNPHEVQQQIEAFHTQMAALHTVYRARIDQAAQRMQTEAARTQPLVVTLRRFVSQQLVRLAHWIEPPPSLAQPEAFEEADVIEIPYRIL